MSPTNIGASTAFSQLQENKLYTGVVVEVDMPLRKVIVQTDNHGVALSCQLASDSLCGMIGLRGGSMPPVGTRVLVAHLSSQMSLVINRVSNDMPDANLAGDATVADVPAIRRSLYKFRPGGMPHHFPASDDLLEGELEIGTAMTGVIRLMMGMAQFGAGDRARVEAHLLEDMVRVVCDTYQHISAFGDFEIYDDGRLNVEWNGTSIPHEAAGVLKADDAKIPQNAETSDADFSQIDKILDRGRWRFSAMLGHLGDMIRLMVTEPTQELGKLAENAFRSGRAHVNVGSDGRVLVQSTDEIALERVCRIRVPIRLKDRRDGGGVMPDDFKTLEQSFTQQWDDVNGGFGPDTLMYQLRVYSRWFSQYSCLAHIHQLSQAEAENKPGPEWKLPLESETPDPKTNAGLPDRPPGFLYRHAYATIRILKDGCIVLWSHDGNSIEMTSEGIRLASVKHLDLEAAGDIRLHAGQSVCVHSRNTAYIESAEGFISTLSHCGTQIHSKGDVDIISESAPTRTKTPEGEEEPEVPEALPVDADRPKKNEKYGVRIQARTASLNVQTLTDVTMMGDNFTFVGNPEHGAIRMTTAHATTNAKFLQLGNLRLEGTNASFIGLVQSTSLQANSAKILYLSSTYVGSVYGFSGGSSRFVSPNAGMGAVELDVLTLPSEELPEPPYEIDPDPNKGGSRIPSNISARLVGPRFESLAQQYIRMDLQADDAAGKARNSFGRYKPFNYRLGLSESPYGHTIKTEITGFTDAIPSLRQPGDLPLDPTFKTSLRGEFTPTKSDTLFYWSREEPAP